MKRRDRDLNPGGHMTIGLAVRRRTRLGHPDITKQDITLYVKSY